jgi:Ner family transcriptional regulator
MSMHMKQIYNPKKGPPMNQAVSQTAPAQDWHPADIKAALEKAGWSLRQLSVENGLAPTTLQHVLTVSYPKGERIVAKALGKQPEEIWPQRYEVRRVKASRRARSRRPRSHTQNTNRATGCNDELHDLS